MAYSSVRVQFEIGHEASLRNVVTPAGLTHDWEVFVRGADNTDIQCFVEKVVFHLHETFPKPRRVIKEPPYVVKESGYAGFVLPIDVYLKNKEEPKKISFQYNLYLHTSGPPIFRILREPRLFQNPSEDFRRKLIRGGGVGVDTPTEVHLDELKTSVSSIKSKGTDSALKKQKIDPPQNDSFAVFGTPIRRVLASKKIPEVTKKHPENDLPKEKKNNSKHATYKDDKETLKDREKYLEKEKNKERDKNKEKSTKRPSPLPTAVPQPLKPKDEYKKHDEKKKEDFDDKKRKKEEKDKREKTKDSKEKDKAAVEKEHRKDKKELKDPDHIKKVSPKSYDGKIISEKHVYDGMEKEKHKHRHKKKEKYKNKEKEKHKKDKDKSEKDTREKEKERERKKKIEDFKEKEEKVKRKSKSPSPTPPEKVKKKPLNALLDELGSSDSASPLSEDESMTYKQMSKPFNKTVPESKTQSILNVNPKYHSTTSGIVETKNDKESFKSNSTKNKKEKLLSKKIKYEKVGEKGKGKEENRPGSFSSEKEDEEIEKERLHKDEREIIERSKPEEKLKYNIKEKDVRKRKGEKSDDRHSKTKKTEFLENNGITCQQSIITEASDETEGIRKSEKFTKEYVAQLKGLQHRIMTLEDNVELQKVVKVIKDTGQYEITKKTFDFDLCALDFETVKKLQDFFSPT